MNKIINMLLMCAGVLCFATFGSRTAAKQIGEIILVAVDLTVLIV